MEDWSAVRSYVRIRPMWDSEARRGGPPAVQGGERGRVKVRQRFTHRPPSPGLTLPRR